MNPLEYLLGMLDKPGRSVRGLLGGHPDEGLAFVPFSDAMGLTDPSRQVSGTDLVHKAGLGTGSDLGDEILGFGAGALTDPLSYVGGAGLFKAAPGLARAFRGSAGRAAGVGDAGSEIGRLADELTQAGRSLDRYSMADPPIEAVTDANRAMLAKYGFKLPINDSGPEISRAVREGITPPVPEAIPHQSPAYPSIADAMHRPDDYAPPLPDYDRMMGFRYGSPAGGDYGVLGDAMLDAGRGAVPSAQKIAASAWQDALPHLEASMSPGVIQSEETAAKTWLPAASRRMIELTTALRSPEAFGISGDMLPMLQQQRGRLADLLDIPAIGTTRFSGGGVKVGANFAFQPGPTGSVASQLTGSDPAIRRLADLAGSADRAATGFAPPSSDLSPLIAAIDNPLLMFDPSAAKAASHRREVGRTSNELISMARSGEETAAFRRSQGQPVEESPATADWLVSLLTGGDRSTPLAALKGAIRTSPEARAAYESLLRQVIESGKELPRRPLMSAI